MSAGRILVLDDDRGMCETIGDVLEQQGYVVQIATRAEAGLEIAAASPIEAAIVDIKLPDMSGIDALHPYSGRCCRRPRSSSSPGTPPATAIQAINGLAFAYLVKPFEMSHLLMTVEQAVRKQRLAQALLESEERYRLVTENIADAVFRPELDGRIVWRTARRGDHRPSSGRARRRSNFSPPPEADPGSQAERDHLLDHLREACRSTGSRSPGGGATASRSRPGSRARRLRTRRETWRRSNGRRPRHHRAPQPGRAAPPGPEDGGASAGSPAASPTTSTTC